MNCATIYRWPELVLCLLLVFGCSSGSPGLPPESVVPVAGTVLVNKKPMAGVSLSFAPTEGTTGRGGVAISDVEGKFRATNSQGTPGLVPGIYQVTFSRWTLADGSSAPPDLPPADAGASEAIDEKWSSPTHVGPHNTITIPSEGTAELKFEISGNPILK